MNRGTKIAVVIMFSIIIIYIVWMISFPGESLNEIEKPVESGEAVLDNEDLVYTITKVSDTQIDLVTQNEYTKTTTQYFFENGKVSNVIILEEINSGDFVEEMFNGMKNDEKMVQIYSDIKLEGNIIKMVLKQDYVDIYEGLNYDELFNELSNSLKISQE